MSPVINGFGQRNGVAIVAQAPSYYEVRRKRIFAGETGQILLETVKQCDLGPVYYTNAVLCAWEGEEPTTEAVNACRPSLLAEIAELGATKVLAMGNAAIQAFCPGSPPVSVTRPNRLRNVDLGIPVVPTYNMAFINHDADAYRDILNDIDVLIGVDTWVEPQAPSYTVVETRAQFFQMLRDIDKTVHWSLDIESSSYNPKEDELLTLGIGDGKHVWIIVAELLDTDPCVTANLKATLENPARFLVGQNWHGFDWKWFWHKYAIDIRVKFDTMLAHYTLDERSVGHGLKAMCKLYLGYPDWAGEIKGKFENYGDIPRDTLYQYQAWDVQGTWELYPVLKQAMIDDDPCLLSVHDDVLLPASQALGQIELNGCPIDTEYMAYVETDITKKLEEIREKLQKISDDVGCTDLKGALDAEEDARENFEWAVQAHARKEITGREKIAIRKIWTAAKNHLKTQRFNPLSQPHVVRLLWDCLRITRDTTRAGLEAVEHLHPAPHAIAVYRQFAKLKGTYVVGIVSRLWVRSDGRLHGDFVLIGTRTGRISSRDPNLQNMPLIVGPVIRNAYVSSDGWVLGEADLSQAEIRVAGVLSQDTKLIELYKNGGDIHRTVAAQMYSVPYDEVTSQQRQDAKPVDFSILYGATAESLVGTGNPPWDLEKAQQAVDGFIGAFPDLGEHFELWKREVLRDGYLKTITGRLRRFPLIVDANRSDIERISINSRIQGSASDHLLMALTRVQLAIFGRKTVNVEGIGAYTLSPDECRLLLTVHDSILFECSSPETFDVYARFLKQEMENPQFETYGMPFEADIKYGKRWGTTQKWKPGIAIDLAAAEADLSHYSITYYYQASDRTPRPLDEVATDATVRRIPATARASADTIKNRNKNLVGAQA